MTNEDWVLISVITFGALSISFLAIVAVALWEKRPIQPFDVPNPCEEYEPSSVAKQENKEAMEIGYLQGGVCHDVRGRLYLVRYDFWIAPDDSTIAVVVSGIVAALFQLNGVWLYSRTQDGRVLCTTNKTGNEDISGVEDQTEWPGLQFKDLVKKHNQRLCEFVVKPFSSDAPLTHFFEINRFQAEALVERNYAYYIDDERKVCRYTLKGAVKFYIKIFWVKPFRRLLRSVGLVRETGYKNNDTR